MGYAAVLLLAALAPTQGLPPSNHPPAREMAGAPPVVRDTSGGAPGPKPSCGGTREHLDNRAPTHRQAGGTTHPPHQRRQTLTGRTECGTGRTLPGLGGVDPGGQAPGLHQRPAPIPGRPRERPSPGGAAPLLVGRVARRSRIQRRNTGLANVIRSVLRFPAWPGRCSRSAWTKATTTASPPPPPPEGPPEANGFAVSSEHRSRATSPPDASHPPPTRRTTHDRHPSPHE